MIKPDYDTLIIGSGAAGLIASIALAESGFRVLVCTKDAVTESSSAYAQGGIAVSLAPDDSIESHIQDTLRVGQGLCDEKIVRFFIGAIEEYVEVLAEWGVPFIGLRRGQIDPSVLAREGAHSHRRVLKVGSDISGRALMKALWEIVCRNPNISISQGTSLIKLIQSPVDGAVIGGAFQDINNNFFQVGASATIIASGGFSSIFHRSTNPFVSTGDGIVCGAEIGALVRKLEYVQFHPTAIDLPNCFLLSEALRGEGSHLINVFGERFMNKYAPAEMELAPRAVVSGAVWKEIQATGKVYLDARPLGLDCIKTRFPNIYAGCLSMGYDLSKEMLPITPAAHYTIGGLAVDEQLRSTVKNLWAIGEVSSTGLHGADRLASNSLLECVVSGFKAAESIKSSIQGGQPVEELPPLKLINTDDQFSILDAREMSKELKWKLWQQASFHFSQKGLYELLDYINVVKSKLPDGLSNNTFANQLLRQTQMSEMYVKACLAAN